MEPGFGSHSSEGQVRRFRAAISFVPLAVAALAAQTKPSVPINEFAVPWARENRPRDPAVVPDGNIFVVGQQASYAAQLDPKMGDFRKCAIDSAAHPHTCVVDSADRSGSRETRTARSIGWIRQPARWRPSRSVRRSAIRIRWSSTVFDKKGNMWFTAQQSNAVGYFDVARLVGFDPRTWKFFSISELKGDKNMIRDMIVDKKTRQIWYGSAEGFIRAGGCGGKEGRYVMATAATTMRMSPPSPPRTPPRRPAESPNSSKAVQTRSTPESIPAHKPSSSRSRRFGKPRDRERRA